MYMYIVGRCIDREGIGNAYAVTANARQVHLWDFTKDCHCVHFRCTIKLLCSNLVPKECYSYLVSVRNEQRALKKCSEHALRAIYT